MLNEEQIRNTQQELDNGTAKCVVCHEKAVDYCDECGLAYCRKHYDIFGSDGNCCGTKSNLYAKNWHSEEIEMEIEDYIGKTFKRVI